MVPQDTVAESAVLLAIGRLNSPTFVRAAQVLFLKWLVLAFPMLDSTATLRGMYGVLFLFIDYETLRPHLCQLLYMLTRRVDVQPFRIRRLLDLQRRVGMEPPVTALLSCYKLYCPHLVSLVITSSRKRWFPTPDAAWLSRLFAVQRRGEDNMLAGADAGAAGGGGGSTNAAAAAATAAAKAIDGKAAVDATDQRSRKRARNDVGIPRALSSSATGGAKGVSIQQVTNFKELLENLEDLELPDQIAAVLASERLQHVLSCSSDAATVQRLEYWLAARLTDEMTIAPGQVTARFTELLNSVVRFSRFMHETSQSVGDFLAVFLQRWNGVDYRDQILELVSLLPPQSFGECYSVYLAPLYNVFTTAKADGKVDILRCFNALARRLVLHCKERQDNAKPAPSLHSHSQSQGGANADADADADGAGPAEFDHRLALSELLVYIDGVCAMALRAEPNVFIIEDAVLDCMELTCQIYSTYGVPTVLVPGHSVVYSMALASTAATVSRFCSVLSAVEAGIKEVQALDTVSELEHTGLDQVDYMKYYLHDFKEMLFLQSIFQPKPKMGTILFNAPVFQRQSVNKGELKMLRQNFRQFVSDSVADLFDAEHIGGSLDLSRRFAGFTYRYLERMQKKVGQKAAKKKLQLSQINQSDKYRARLLKFLNTQHLGGLNVFLSI